LVIDGSSSIIKNKDFPLVGIESRTAFQKFSLIDYNNSTDNSVTIILKRIEISWGGIKDLSDPHQLRGFNACLYHFHKCDSAHSRLMDL
jgi:hypothetical protein